MSVISKVVGSLAKPVAKYTGKALKVTKNVEGIPVTTYLKTGTKVARNVDGAGAKSIELGMGSRLRSELGIENIISYPKGSFFGGEAGAIVIPGKNGRFLPLTPQEFGDFVKMYKEIAPGLRQEAQKLEAIV